MGRLGLRAAWLVRGQQGRVRKALGWIQLPVLPHASCGAVGRRREQPTAASSLRWQGFSCNVAKMTPAALACCGQRAHATGESAAVLWALQRMSFMEISSADNRGAVILFNSGLHSHETQLGDTILAALPLVIDLRSLKSPRGS